VSKYFAAPSGLVQNSASDVSAAVKGDMLITLIIPSNDRVHAVASQELEFTGYMRGLRNVVPSPIKVIDG